MTFFGLQATLIFLMDHLALVVSASDRNKMSAQNLATALAPPLMLHSSAESSSLVSTASGLKQQTELDYTQPINVLKYLLQIWPVPKHHAGNVLFTIPADLGGRKNMNGDRKERLRLTRSNACCWLVKFDLVPSLSS